MSLRKRKAGSGTAAASRLVVGWREWVAIDALRLPAIKAKLDTGARTSALHAFYVEPITVGGTRRIRFGIHPLQRRRDIAVHCVAEAIDHRQVTDSGGHRELRWVIEAAVRLGAQTWPIEITLTNRDDMMFRMLIGRSAMGARLLVDPARSYVLGLPPRGLYAEPAAKKKRRPGESHAHRRPGP
jgi:hypothetical protein